MPNYTTATDVVNTALQELGLGQVNLNSAALDQTGYQCIGLLNALGDDLLRVHDWQYHEKQMGFVGDGVSDTFPLPADFGRQVNQTEWSSSANRPMQGPVSPQTWAWDKFGIVAPGVYYQYRILGDKYAIYPVPGDGEEFSLFYIRKYWVQKAVTDPPAPEPEYSYKITNPDDILLFDRRVLIAGLKYKFWSAKGLDTTQLANEFNMLVSNEKATNQGAPVISLSGGGFYPLIGWQNTPDSGYGI